ncbi:hypothetical protein [Mesorhizobium sp. M7A.F.Ca.ET.027.03.2.1]|uniref:phage major tropism determinant n=1 Tax=Mesorhizobium sp. M7A.F.Ca.ET.027.03.2.1 TaxID=2496656 RepID=UPI000FCC21CE|nr:hypothetical protein [Mesorhizobium sp. M7A.F.Ca.ET.027.03.2.1]RVD64769.1 hypothetical protein EN750_11160 [Mesorhizobium sp. M7A.F.Ca.ET.027.03.2.1]
MNATAKIPALGIDRADISSCIFIVTGNDTVSIKAGTVITVASIAHAFESETPIDIVEAVPGYDYGVFIAADGKPRADRLITMQNDGAIFGGFHFAPSGNALARIGGDGVPAINPFSCWDLGFRPACPDPRGMALVDGRFWADIYLLGIDHLTDGTSRFGQIIADGRSLPVRIDGEGRTKKLDYATAVEIYAHHGKGLLGAEEFFAAAYGVTERTSREEEPETTGDVSADGKKFVSRWGLFDVTGTMWQWGTDGDPDNPRASFFGGSWLDGSGAGSRCAGLVYWPEDSAGSVSARGRSDHLKPAA